ncbi:protein tyrosine phosphatase [Lichtheimia corymbifera JMRC:FSU:9682]|uniref:protein-tyrosine-phosphatase n=1 Tax=Lichtheimia corymbifera JMRC:FSU:9682 TaxID=1263082 RepID=A0A068S550_9FUNG|nr:protein tyrosine phosphatase [Lichtheimia corymbifera JMRC:FSU:9682]
MVNTATTTLDVDNRKQRYAMPTSRSPLTRVLSLIECPQSSIRFLILDCPTESTLDFYIEQFEQLNVTTVVRCCQPTYNAERVKSHNIGVMDLPFKDGGTPPPDVVRAWLTLVETTKNKQPGSTIAVHCVAGLGRAPLLVAIALIEMGMKPLDAIEYIRGKRRGSFNKVQIDYLDRYKRILKSSSSSSFGSSFLGRMFGIGKTIQT